ncbi:hypothetical protein GE21DRAFT_1275399 [Neurospora crassa]|nr:hypothetical protein GE21DRAFT_1275399 [Neurospora crassa]
MIILNLVDLAAGYRKKGVIEPRLVLVPGLGLGLGLVLRVFTAVLFIEFFFTGIYPIKIIEVYYLLLGILFTLPVDCISGNFLEKEILEKKKSSALAMSDISNIKDINLNEF